MASKETDPHSPPNPLEPTSLCGHNTCQCAVPSSSVSVHCKLVSAPAVDTPGQDVNYEPLKTDGEISVDTTDQTAYDTLALSSRLFSRHLETQRKRVELERIMVVQKHHVGGLAGKSRELVEWLLGRGFVVIVERFLETDKDFDAKGMLAGRPDWRSRLKFWNTDTCNKDAQKIDLVITLGGDGTVLFTSFMFQHVVPPVVSFALGSFGFLTRLDFKGYRESLTDVFENGMKVCLRTRLSVRFMRSKDIGIPFEERTLTDELLGSRRDEETHEPGEKYVVLNEVVVDRGSGLTVSNTELYSLEEHISNVIADGVLVSTPTGSTAYNLAAGGPLCHPDMSSIIVTPICPHSLTFRPVVLPDSMVLRLGVPYDAIQPSSVKLDGRKQVDLKRGDYIQINVSRFPFAVVQTNAGCDREWFDSISKSFSWGFRQPNGNGDSK